MTKFRDSSGKEWTINLTLRIARNIEQNRKVKILGIEGADTLASLPFAPDLLYDVVSDCVQEKQKGTLEESWNGATCSAAYEALMTECNGFLAEDIRPQIEEFIKDIQQQKMARNREWAKMPLEKVIEMGKQNQDMLPTK